MTLQSTYSKSNVTLGAISHGFKRLDNAVCDKEEDGEWNTERIDEREAEEEDCGVVVYISCSFPWLWTWLMSFCGWERRARQCFGETF